MSDSDIEMTNQDSEDYEYISYEDSMLNTRTTKTIRMEIPDGSEATTTMNLRNGSSSSFMAPGSGSKRQLEYRVLDQEQLSKRKDHAVSQLVELLCISHDEAQILLRHYKWDQGRTESEWFNDEGRVRDLCGIPEAKKKNEKSDAGQKNTLGKRVRQRGSNPQTPTAPGDGSKTNALECGVCLIGLKRMIWIHYVVGIVFVKAVGHSTCPLALPLGQCVQRLLAQMLLVTFESHSRRFKRWPMLTPQKSGTTSW